MLKHLLLASTVCCMATVANAHDTWLQTNTNVVRTGDAVHVDLKLGNHGNAHRDFKLARKVSLHDCKLEVIVPDGKQYDIKENLVDNGYTPQEGFWSAKVMTSQPGLYLVAHTFNNVHNRTRGIKGAKVLFVASDSLDKVPADITGFDKPRGHPLELVPETNVVTQMGPGKPIKVRLLYQGKPLADTRISFIPRGEVLSGDFDENYERRTDKEGRASFTPKAGNYYLVVARHTEPEQKGDEYDRTSYSAALTVLVPELCACCAELEPEAGTAAATGIVTVNGKPVPKGKVIFHLAGKKPVKFEADIKEDGGYEFQRKIPAGRMSVTLEFEGVPAQFSAPDKTPLVVETRTGKNQFNFNLKN